MHNQSFRRGRKRNRRYLSNRGNNSDLANEHDSEDDMNSSVSVKPYKLIYPIIPPSLMISAPGWYMADFSNLKKTTIVFTEKRRK